MYKLLIKCICFPAAAMLIIFLLNIPYQKIDDAKYLDLQKYDMLGNQINDIQIANIEAPMVLTISTTVIWNTVVSVALTMPTSARPITMITLF